MERGDAPEFDAFLASHPAHAEALRRMHDEAAPSPGLDGGRPGAWSLFLDRLPRLDPSRPRYRLEGEIARGGMGVVLRVRDELLRRPLAMKVVASPPVARGDPSSDAGALGRFLEEAQVTAQLQHPGIVPVHELGVAEDGRVYFTMPLVEGEDLHRVFTHVATGEEGWSEVRAVGVILRACEAVAFAHERGVLHRDLKPSNVMVGRFLETYVLDWGLARLLEPVDRRADRRPDAPGATITSERKHPRDPTPRPPAATLDGDVVGTPAYMAPEQARGEIARVGPRSDVYGMGAILYELLAARRPYATAGERGSAHDLLDRVRDGPPAPIREVAPRAPAELTAICKRAMAREPDDRYPDMRSLADDLRAYLEGRVVTAHRIGALESLRKWVGRNRALAATAVLALASLLAGAAAVAIQQRQNTRAVARERNVARAVADFQSAMLQADPWEDGRLVTALEMAHRAAGRLPGEFAADPEMEAAVRDSLAETFLAFGEPAAAEGQLSRVVALRTAAHGPDDPRTLGARQRWAETLHDAGRLEEAVREQRAVADTWIRIAGRDDPRTLHARSALSLLLSAVSPGPEVERLETELVEAYRRRLGDDHPSTVIAVFNLASTLCARGECTSAEPMFRDVLERQVRRFGADSRETWRAQAGLAQVLRRLGRIDEAERLDRNMLAAYRRVLGPRHPETLTVLNNHAERLHALGRVEEAVPLAREVLAARRSRLGPDHPDTWTAEANLAAHLVRLGAFDEGERLARAALARRRERLGDSHPHTWQSMENVADLLARSGRLDEAETAWREVVERRAADAPDDPGTWNAREKLARCLSLDGRHREALALREEVLARYRELHGPDATRTLVVACGAAFDARRCEDASRAAELERHVLEVWSREREPTDPELLTLATNHAVTLHHLGEPGAAADRLDEVVRIRCEAEGVASEEVSKAMRLLVEILVRGGDPDRAERSIAGWRARAEAAGGDAAAAVEAWGRELREQVDAGRGEAAR
ncbi:MAG: tetratricopeptide repeat protein [Planctomycetota bacterium JB042]